MVGPIRARLRAVSPRSWRNLFALAVPFALGALLVAGWGGDEPLTAQRLRAEVVGLGAAGLAAFLLASLLRPLAVLVSGSIFALAAGMIWGPFLGTVLAAAGALLANALLVALARALGTGAVRDLAGERWGELAANAQARGFSFVFVGTLGYALPTDLVVAVAASTGMRARTILLAATLGSLPGTAAMAFVGATFSDPAAAPWWIGGGAAAGLTCLSLVLARRLFRGAPARQAPRLSGQRA